MKALAFWKAVAVDACDFLERVVGLLDEGGVRFCVVGGQAVNAYAEPLVSLDLDLVAAADQWAQLEAILVRELHVERFAHSLNVSSPGSDLRVQFQTDPRYAGFLDRAQVTQVLGMDLPVAAVEDVLMGKVWAALDPSRRPSKRQKDLADIARLLEARPDLRERVPQDILDGLVK